MDRLKTNWILLYSTADPVRAAIVRGRLEENQIPVTVIDKKDSSYVFLGEIEVWVPVHFRELAADLLSGALSN